MHIPWIKHFQLTLCPSPYDNDLWPSDPVWSWHFCNFLVCTKYSFIFGIQHFQLTLCWTHYDIDLWPFNPLWSWHSCNFGLYKAQFYIWCACSLDPALSDDWMLRMLTLWHWPLTICTFVQSWQRHVVLQTYYVFVLVSMTNDFQKGNCTRYYL